MRSLWARGAMAKRRAARRRNTLIAAHGESKRRSGRWWFVAQPDASLKAPADCFTGKKKIAPRRSAIPGNCVPRHGLVSEMALTDSSSRDGEDAGYDQRNIPHQLFRICQQQKNRRRVDGRTWVSRIENRRGAARLSRGARGLPQNGNGLELQSSPKRTSESSSKRAFVQANRESTTDDY